jgi:DNA modification methylase
MAVMHQEVAERYAAYNGDSCEFLPSLASESVHLSIYSPPFFDLYTYSSSERDLSNSRDYDEFINHYEFIVSEVRRLTLPGRISCVHCCDIPIPGQHKGYRDFPGDIIRLHQRIGFFFQGRIAIWKEPRRVALRTRLQHLTHKNLVKDSTVSFPAGADYLLAFKKHGDNKVPVTHPTGLSVYAGEREIPPELLRHAGQRRQEINRLSQWIWQQYASPFWDDIRIDRVLPYKESREPDDEKHVCPLQQDVIERCLTLWSNPGEVVLSPFMGVGSEIVGALINGRKGVGCELKTSYYKQAVKNIRAALDATPDQAGLFDSLPDEDDEDDHDPTRYLEDED